ncbi:MAG: hypothetical protein SPE74_07775 [Oscillospiraceae bacterium]|nr:hypothetical protein [bacterium]MDY5101293.1 hypothetical protein [Oscillospiraceae bacterium]
MRREKMERWVNRFMNGRYGADQYGLFLSVGSVVLLCLSFFFGLLGGGKSRISSFFFYSALALLVWCSFRIFSRGTERRRRENRLFLEQYWRVQDWAKLQKTRFEQRRDYVFFRCPGCRHTMRVPRGKGKIRITCRRCGYTFERKT